MNLHRVLKYEATVYYTSTGSSHTAMYPFTQEQANEVGAVLETDGIDIFFAKRLCEIWTRRGQHADIRYSYRIPFGGTRCRGSGEVETGIGMQPCERCHGSGA